jgi:hypothetical protein
VLAKPKSLTANTQPLLIADVPQATLAAHRMALLESRITAPGSTPSGQNALVISMEGGFSERSNSLSNPFAHMQHANPAPPPR